LAAHLQVPLPYLLYRAQTRYEEDLRGLQEVRGALSPSTQVSPHNLDEFPFNHDRSNAVRLLNQAGRSSGSTPRLVSSTRLTTPLSARSRLNATGEYSSSIGTTLRPKKASSSSTLTLQAPSKSHRPLSPTSQSSSEEPDSEEEYAAKEEEADRQAEEREALDRKLAELQTAITSEALGFVSSSKARDKGKGRQRDDNRGRIGQGSTRPLSSSQGADLSSRSQSISSTSMNSPQDSIPSMPSSPPQSLDRHLSPAKSSSPPVVSSKNVAGQNNLAVRPVIGRAGASEGSQQGSSASSFSDLSGESEIAPRSDHTEFYFGLDASLSPSALESALMSNIRGGGSRL
jgi:hypothetical protein